MIEYTDDLAQLPLFYDIAPGEIDGLLGCIRARRAEYTKGGLIIEEGSRVHDFGVVLSGHARAIKWDAADKVIIITLLEKGGGIGIMLAASPERISPVSVQALDDVSVLLIPFDRVFERCEKACSGHDRLLRNYINMIAEKGLMLHERINCLIKPTVRDKVVTYLSRVSAERQSRIFTIPFDRNAMAEYLNVERSALSRELSKMKRDGLVDYHKNAFRLP